MAYSNGKLTPVKVNYKFSCPCAAPKVIAAAPAMPLPLAPAPSAP